MWLSVVVVGSVILITGLRQTQSDIVALVNPDQISEETPQFAQGDSPLASLSRYAGDLQASLRDVFSFSSPTVIDNPSGERSFPIIRPALLPRVSERPEAEGVE